MKPTVLSSSPQEEFPYGWRYVRRGDEFEQVPLTLEDVLHPREGDVIPENTFHAEDCRYLASVFADRPLSPAVGLVTEDLIINWGVPGIRNHSPDVGVFVGLSRNPGQIGTLDLVSLGGRCELVLEVVSPSTRKNDVVDKFDHYYRVGIPLYVLIDQRDEGEPRWLRAYRHTPAGYAEVAADGQGRILLPPLGLLLGMRDDRPVCFDAATGQEVRDYSGLSQHSQRVSQDNERLREQVIQQKEETDRAMTDLVDACHAAEGREATANEKAERASQDAERERQAREAADLEADRQRQAREAADLEAQRERQAREASDLEAERQRQAREAADLEAERQRQAREASDLEAQRERQAREAADQRIRELEEALRRSQAGGTGHPTSP